MIERRHFLQLIAGAVVLPLTPQNASAQSATKPSPSASSVRPLAERLAAYAHELRYDRLDPTTIERVKAHLIDTLGCGIAAFDERPVRACREIALAPSAGTSTIVGTSKSATPDLAAFANAVAFRYYDLNDVYVGRVAAHPSGEVRVFHVAVDLAGEMTGTFLSADCLQQLSRLVECRQPGDGSKEQR